MRRASRGAGAAGAPAALGQKQAGSCVGDPSACSRRARQANACMLTKWRGRLQLAPALRGSVHTHSSCRQHQSPRGKYQRRQPAAHLAVAVLDRPHRLAARKLQVRLALVVGEALLVDGPAGSRGSAAVVAGRAAGAAVAARRRARAAGRCRARLTSRNRCGGAGSGPESSARSPGGGGVGRHGWSVSGRRDVRLRLLRARAAKR